MRDKKDDNSPVGFGAPPVHTRFKKGQSGNPKGRPKGSKNIKTDLEQEMNEKVSIRENGKTKKISKRKLILKAQIKKAAEGDSRAAACIFKLNHDLGLGAGNAPDSADTEKGAELNASLIEIYKQVWLEEYTASLASKQGGKRKKDKA